jgi:ABC-type multidrug transport system ATPase subunit/ABC-type multidrug transport system permease subunit
MSSQNNLETMMPLTATKSNKPTLNIDKTKECYLRWTNIVKTVEIKDQSVGLISSSIGGTTSSSQQKEASQMKIILNQISGQAKPGQILALMGPSGSGKTSLLDVLASRSTYNAGTIYLNNSSMTDNPAKMKSIKRKIAYIKQKDIFFEHLSVKDQLMYTAFLRLGDDYSKEEKMDEVDKVIELLRLEKCADTPIMLVSGGERKRVNIGTELLTNPSIIMLDEPTSGLDSTSAVALMSLLVSLAHDHGKTVITSIHQPSSAVFRKFDNVLFLADGCVVYYGSPADSLLYCKNLGYACPDGYNSADHWMDLLVEDSAIPTNDAGNNDNLNTASFPIKLNNDNDIENNFINHHQPGGDDETTELSITTANNSSSTSGRKSNRFGSVISRKFSTMTQTSNKGPHLLQLTKVKRDEYLRLKTPKASLINAWDVDQYAEQVEAGITDLNGSEYSSGTTSSDVNDEISKEKKFNTSWSTQFMILLHRSLKNSSAAIWKPINFFKSVALAILTGLLWFQVPHDEMHISDRHSFIFFAITYWIFDGTFTAIFTFPTEREIIFKERASGSYYLSAYFLSKTMSEMPTRLSLPVIFWTIAYWMSGINSSFTVFLGTMGCMLLAVLAGESYGLLCGAVVMDFEKAMTIMVVISLTTMAAGGFYVQNIPVWLEWVKYLSPFKFGYEASQLMIFDSDVLCDGSGALAAYCTEGVEYATREQILEFINSEGSIAFNIGILLVLIFVPRYLSFLALKAKRGAERS